MLYFDIGQIALYKKVIVMGNERNNQQGESPQRKRGRWEMSPMALKIFSVTNASLVSLLTWIFILKVPLLLALAITGVGVGVAVLFLYRFTKIW